MLWRRGAPATVEAPVALDLAAGTAWAGTTVVATVDRAAAAATVAWVTFGARIVTPRTVVMAG